MKRFKDLSFNEKLLLLMTILLIIAIVFKWPKIKEGFVKGWEKFGIELEK